MRKEVCTSVVNIHHDSYGDFVILFLLTQQYWRSLMLHNVKTMPCRFTVIFLFATHRLSFEPAWMYYEGGSFCTCMTHKRQWYARNIHMLFWFGTQANCLQNRRDAKSADRFFEPITYGKQITRHLALWKAFPCPASRGPGRNKELKWTLKPDDF